MRKKVGAFIHVNYNNSQLTLNCIVSIRAFDLDSTIIIIDNNSTETEKKILSDSLLIKDDKKILLQFEETNLGYFRALNSGIKLILNSISDYDFVFVGNNDLIFKNDFFEKINNTKYSPEAYVVSPNVIKTNGIHQNPFSINGTSKTRKLLYRLIYLNYTMARIVYGTANRLGVMKSEMDRKGHEVSQYIFAGHGSCYVLTPSYFKTNTLMDQSSFLMGEEFLLAKQIRDTGGKIFYDSELIVIHNEHSSMDKIPSKTKYKFEQQAFRLFKNIC